MKNGAKTVPTAGVVRRADFRSWDEREALLPRGNGTAFNAQAKEMKIVRDRINKNTGLFEPRSVCGCVSPALLLWIINFVAFVVHTSMGVAVLVEGGKNPDKMAFQITQVIGTWHNLTIDGYTWSVNDSSLGKWRLDVLCAAFAFISAGFHFLVCCFSFFALSTCPCLKLNYIYYLYIERCCIWWCVADHFEPQRVMATSLCRLPYAIDFVETHLA